MHPKWKFYLQLSQIILLLLYTGISYLQDIHGAVLRSIWRVPRRETIKRGLAEGSRVIPAISKISQVTDKK